MHTTNELTIMCVNTVSEEFSHLHKNKSVKRSMFCILYWRKINDNERERGGELGVEKQYGFHALNVYSTAHIQ